MTTNSFSKKVIHITITLDEGGGNATQLAFTSHACQVRIQKQGLPELPSASVTIWGLSLDQMAQLTMLSFDARSLRKNAIKVEAGSEGQDLSTVFIGEITNSAPNFGSIPSPTMQIDAITTSYPRLIPSPPVAVQGTQKATALISQFAKQCGLNFTDGGVVSSLKDCIINGDLVTKMRWVADSVGADLVIDDKEAVLLPRDKSRKAVATVRLISPETGEIGYPSFDQQGIRFSCFFAPDLKLAGNVKIESTLPRASGVWKIYSLVHELAANLPNGGVWRTSAAATWISN